MVERGRKVFVLKTIIIILGSLLLCQILFLSMLSSEDFEYIFEENIEEFYHKYVLENDLFPIEYRSDIGQMDKVLKMIKENPKDYSYIPSSEMFFVEVHVQVFTGRCEIIKKLRKLLYF